MVDEAIVKVVVEYLKNISEQGIPVEYGVVIGSQATGSVDAWSDIDLLVVSARFDEDRRREDINLLWRTAARIDSRIEPIPVGQRQYSEDDVSTIIEIARREGQVIPLID